MSDGISSVPKREFKVSGKPRLLDLFCGAGGAAVGYDRAGFDVTGMDIEPQPNYPFEFVRADAADHANLNFLMEFDAIHASPPCQGYASLANKDGRHPKLIAPVRELLLATGLPYVIENIQDAKPELRDPVRLCGSTFGLHVRRHRMFETNWPLTGPECRHAEQGEIRAYYGKKGWLVWRRGGAQVQSKDRKPLLRGSVDQALADMGIDWMTWDELRESIPPAYTEYVGLHLRAQLMTMPVAVAVAA